MVVLGQEEQSASQGDRTEYRLEPEPAAAQGAAAETPETQGDGQAQLQRMQPQQQPVAVHQRMHRKESQENMPRGIVSMFSESTARFRNPHSANAFCFTSVTFGGITISSSPEQPKNAFRPISFRESGSSMRSDPKKQDRNASSEMISSPSGRRMSATSQP